MTVAGASPESATKEQVAACTATITPCGSTRPTPITSLPVTTVASTKLSTVVRTGASSIVFRSASSTTSAPTWLGPTTCTAGFRTTVPGPAPTPTPTASSIVTGKTSATATG